MALRELLKKGLEETTAHGLGRTVGQRHIVIRVWWSIACLASFGVIIWQCEKLFVKYYEYNVNVKIDMQYNSELDFPAVTICNLNQFRLSKLHIGGQEFGNEIQSLADSFLEHFPPPTQSSNQTTNGTSPIDGATTQLPNTTTAPPPSRKRKKRTTGDQRKAPDSGFTPSVDYNNAPWLAENSESLTYSTRQALAEAMSSLSQQQRIDMGHDANNLIQECSWNGKTCSPANFSGFNNAYFGNCFTFNHDDLPTVLSTSKTGPLYGLSLTLYVETNEYVPALTSAVGVRVLVHVPDKQPFPEDEGIDVHPGTKTSVGLKYIKVTRETYPYPSDCTDGSDIYLLYDKTYSIQACIRTCKQEAVIDECGCANALEEAPENETICKSDKLDCVNSVLEQFERKELTCTCPQSCLDQSFSMTVSSSVWPANSYGSTLLDAFGGRDGIPDFESVEKLRDNMIKLDIYYQELNEQTFKEEPAYLSENLLGDLGGQMGLWMGISVLTIAELIELVSTIIYTVCKKLRHPEKVHVKNDLPLVEKY
ncbi:unnamed protein product [Owenia fusiformis]|uniref:Uncharacterized protein n=1 Tax=Owenia fusiformis TaxID=6347 RepID=A0A8S4PR92_OWEFU|nr:unnamed protein product [Owenia fusiformis]